MLDTLSTKIKADCYDVMETHELTLQPFDAEKGAPVPNFPLRKASETAAGELAIVMALRQVYILRAFNLCM